MNERPEEITPPSARRQETRDRLFDAAMQVFAEDGLRGASVEAICARAGFTRGAFYSNFTSKEQLFLELLGRGFADHARELARKALALEPELRAREGGFTPEEAGRYIIGFLAPSHDHEIWFALEMELLLLAVRDPSLISERFDFKAELYRGIARPVERIVAAAGRRFTIPVERALPVLGGIYEDALRAAALSGSPSVGAFDEVADRMAELLFALTEELEEAIPSGR